MKIQQLFQYGMKRHIPELLEPPYNGLTVELGAGNNPVPGAVTLDYPEWDVNRDDLPCEDDTVDAIYAFHFMEHVPGERAIHLLREIERVLKVGGIFTAVTPHYSSCLAYRDLDHKSFWTLETWDVLMRNRWYSKHSKGWHLEIHANFVMGVDERYLALLTQLVKR